MVSNLVMYIHVVMSCARWPHSPGALGVLAVLGIAVVITTHCPMVLKAQLALEANFSVAACNQTAQTASAVGQ